MSAEGDENTCPLLDGQGHPESGCERREEGTKTVSKSGDEEDGKETKPLYESENATECDDVDRNRGKKRKIRRKKPKKRAKEIPVDSDVIVIDPKPGPSVQTLQRQVEEVQNIVRENVEKLVDEREQKLQALEATAEELNEAASDFRKVTHRAVVRARLKSKKWKIRIACMIVLVVLVLVAVGVVLYVCLGLRKC